MHCLSMIVILKKESLSYQASSRALNCRTVSGDAISRQTIDDQLYFLQMQGICMGFVGTTSIRNKQFSPIFLPITGVFRFVLTFRVHFCRIVIPVKGFI